MLITGEVLRKHGACQAGIQTIERLYPNGATVTELLMDKRIPKEMLHWGRKQLTYTEEDLGLYCKICNIVNTEGYWYSQDVSDSKYIIKSKNVIGSHNVFESFDVTTSMDIVNSDQVLDSKQIFYSSMIDQGEKVFKGRNVTESFNICNSTMVARSRSIIDSFNIFYSSELVHCEDASNSYFCKDCKDIKNCMFCDGLEGAEYHIFNKPVDENHFKLFEKQYLKMMTEPLEFVRDWPSDFLSPTYFLPTRKFDDWYSQIPDRFWKWVRTIPGFDSLFLYNITMNPDILID